MSLYAFPGPLSFHSHDDDPEWEASIHPLYRVNDSSAYYEFAQAMSKKYNRDSNSRYQHHYQDTSKIVVDYSHVQTLLNAASSRKSSNLATSEGSYDDHNDSLKIKVKRGFIDFQKLARTTANGKVNKMPLRQRGSRVHHRHEDSQDNIWYLDPHECAIEFELFVSYIGRAYTATRSLHQLVQLQKDLEQEFRNDTNPKCSKFSRTKTSSNCSSTTEDLSDDDEEEDTTSRDSSFGHWSCEDTAQPMGTDQSYSNSIRSLTIPELPSMSAERLGGPGCGFTRMTAMLHSYQPDLEAWFRAITRIVSEDSPIFSDFLWEPLSAESLDGFHDSCSKLSSIQESFNDDAFGKSNILLVENS